MQCAQRCAEGSGDWERAELWASRVSQRYPGSSALNWLLFCMRTGHGDEQAARDLARQAFEGVDPNGDSAGDVAIFHWLCGEPALAYQGFKTAYAKAPSTLTCTMMILAADQAGDAAARAEAMRNLLSRHREEAPKTATVCELLDKAAPTGAPPDLQAADAIIQSIPPERRGNTAFVAGLWLAHRGRHSEARNYLESSAHSPGVPEWMRALASVSLRGK
jgi:hypothetical protein